jgi:hypothetical protein
LFETAKQEISDTNKSRFFVFTGQIYVSIKNLLIYTIIQIFLGENIAVHRNNKRARLRQRSFIAPIHPNSVFDASLQAMNNKILTKEQHQKRVTALRRKPDQRRTLHATGFKGFFLNSA